MSREWDKVTSEVPYTFGMQAEDSLFPYQVQNQEVEMKITGRRKGKEGGKDVPAAPQQ